MLPVSFPLLRHWRQTNRQRQAEADDIGQGQPTKNKVDNYRSRSRRFIQRQMETIDCETR